MNKLDIPKPWYISATLLNAKNYVASGIWGDVSSPIERDFVNSLEGICTEENSMKEALKPVFDSLSNAFGYKKSDCFDEQA